MSAAPKELTIGIDLGTTNSCMAIVEDGVVRVIPNGGHLTTPSIIAFTADGRRLVGHPAKRQAITNPEHTVIAMKRLIGRKFEGLDADPAMARQAGLIEGPHGDVRVALRDATYSLPELNGMLLQELRAAAEDDLKSPVNRAVITVPAYFNDNQRQATRDAGAIAGLDVVAILNEPTAAALAYGANAKGTRTVVVYDLGGGTFDVSVVRTSNGNLVEVLATGGNTMLGGEDFDARIMKWLLETAKKELDVDLSGDRMALQRLKFVAETAKCALSSAEQTEINLPFIATRANGEGVNLVRTFTRAELNFLLEDLVQQTLEECASVLWASKVPKEKIDDVLLVGGSSRLPAVQAAVTAFFGKAPSQRVNPDEAPAIGAALHADALAHGSGTVKLHDVTPQTLGILTAGLKPYPIIARNTRVPTTKTITFETRQGQANVDLLVIQGDAKKARDNTLLGKFRMSGLGKSETKIDVTFALDTDGIVQVTARDHASGREKSIQVTARSGLTDQERVDMAAASSAYIAEKRNETERKRAEQEALVERTKQERARAAAAPKASAEPATKAPSRKTSGKMRAVKPADSWGPPPPAADEAKPEPKPAAPTRRASGKLRAPKVEPPAPPPLPVVEEPPPPKPPTRRSSGKLRAPPKLDSWGPPPPPVEQASAKPAAKIDSWGPPPPVAEAKPAFEPLAARPKESEPPVKAPAAKGPPPIPVAPVKLDAADEAALDDFTAELEQMKKKLPKRSE